MHNFLIPIPVANPSKNAFEEIQVYEGYWTCIWICEYFNLLAYKSSYMCRLLIFIYLFIGFFIQICDACTFCLVL